MFPKINPTTTQSWASLAELAKNKRSIRELFESDPHRAEKLSRELESVHFDFSKNSIDDTVISTLQKLAEECGVPAAIDAMFNGEEINQTEKRAVLHTELRQLSTSSKHDDLVKSELKKVEAFSQRIISGDWKGHDGKRITNIVNIGIGGSDLGPKMITYALKPFWKTITPHFVSNVDAQQLVEELEDLDPASTLFIIASKTFTTQETMTNAISARDWFLENGGNQEAISKHFVAVSTNKEAVESFGIDATNMFSFWNWVGGRYSLWSTIGLIIACTVGYEKFKELLVGAEKMDTHFRESDMKNNIPVTAALVGIWHNNFLNYDSQAILPYDHRLRFLPSYLQQADMESNGKYVDRNGKKVDYETGPIIWGEPGTNGQHAFYQLIHQGTKIIPADFIAVANAAHSHTDHHEKLLSNFFAQSEALLNGKTEAQVTSELQSLSPEERAELIPFKVFEGERPSTSILLDELSPFNLGMLVAFYEHKIFVQGVIWNIFSFDQWGVELGKQLAKPILEEINSGNMGNHDASTLSLMNKFQAMRK